MVKTLGTPQAVSEKMEQRVIELFNQSIEAKMSAGEALVHPILGSASLLVQALLGEGRIFTCGNGLSAAHANTFAYLLLNQFRIERPGFAAQCLSSDALAGSGLAQQSNFTEIYSRQLRALSRPGDVLVLFSAGSNASNLVQATLTAHDREMTVVAFTGPADNNISALLTGDDIEIRADCADPYRIQEIQLLALFTLCELIELNLFGG